MTVKLSRSISLKKSKRILRTVEDVERLAYVCMVKSRVDYRIIELLQAVIDLINPPPPPDARANDVFTDEQLDNFFTQACTDAAMPSGRSPKADKNPFYGVPPNWAAS
jgi:hypothetical protein